MTVLTQRIRARFSSKSLPAELVAAGKLPGTTFPGSSGASTSVSRSTRAGPGLPASDLIVDLSRISLLPSACAEFLPGPGYVEIGMVAGVPPRPEAIPFSNVPPCDLVPDHTGRRTY